MANASAMKFLAQLPVPKNKSLYDPGNDSWFARRDGGESSIVAAPGKGSSSQQQWRQPPPYGKRSAFIPRKVEDFGDGGAFPEIHVAQYPLEMGRKEDKSSSNVLPVTVDAQGRVAYDAIVKQGENAKKTVFSQHSDLVPKLHETLEKDLAEADDEEAQKTAERTKAALDKIVAARISAAQPKTIAETSRTPTFIKYTPSHQSAEHNSGAKERVIRMVEMPQDPLDPPKFKHKRVPKASGSPPVPIMHSPPRPVTVKDQQDWKIPPCISNWKNAKGYTIPLDKRLAADGRGLQEVQINDNFARLSESLYVAENKAREEVEMRSKIQKERMLLEKEKKEQELRLLAQKARMERAGTNAPGRDTVPVEAGPSTVSAAGGGGGGFDDEPRGSETREEREERVRREALREERRKERERERRLEAKDSAAGPAGKKSKLTRDRDRDISEKIALGMASTGAGTGEVAYDQRLFNQEQGMASGFAAEDTYNVYDKGLFNREGAGGLYKVRKGVDDEMFGGSGEGSEMDKLLRTERFKPDKGFAGAGEGTGVPRDGPVEFEKDAVEADIFGLDQFLSTVKGGKKGNALDKIGSSGGMRASGGSGPKESYEGAPSRGRIDFERGGR